MTDRYVFVNDRGSYIAQDNASGGYPYETDSIFQAYPFYTVEEAERYYDVMKQGVEDPTTYARVLTWGLRRLVSVELEAVAFDK